MSTMTRDDLRERLHAMKRLAWPRASMERIGMELNPTDDATWSDAIEVVSDREQIDLYLRQFVAPIDENRCPCCERGGGFSWGLAHGSGDCWCGWPGTLIHYIADRREHPDIICGATINGHRVCEARRGDHVPEETTWNQGTGAEVVRVELRCPTPSQPPGLRHLVTPTYRPPDILRMTRLLWVHPYAVHLP